MIKRKKIYTITKRIFDMVTSSFLLLLMSPVMIIISLVILKKLGRPVLFIHPRAGFKGKPFFLYKFRTMSEKFDNHGALLPDGDRMTPLGRKLRALSLDELPQLWNVLKGNMSMVGPRPLLLEYNELYSYEQRKRLDVKPGITGWAQVNGRNSLTWEEKFALDVCYVRNRSWKLDFKILYLTLFTVFKRKGISSEGHVTMKKFRGSK